MKYIIIILVLLSFSCSKNRDGGQLYNGTVVGIANGCAIPPGYPYKIKFDDVTLLDENHPIRIKSFFDSSCITILPDEYKIIGKKIKFSFRKTNAGEEFTCNSNVGYYQVIITDISSNQ